MEPPYVESLSYTFLVLEPERFDFAQAAPLERRLGDFECTLGDGRLLARPMIRFETEEEAREQLEPLLRSWECVAELRDGARVEFSFHGSSINEGTHRRAGTVLGMPYSILEAPPEPERPAQYPAPLGGPFDENGAVAEMRELIRGIRAGRDLLNSANYLLTALERTFGGPPKARQRRKTAAATLNIEFEVLRTLGNITARYGSREHRPRKATATKELTEQHVEWLIAALRRLAVRVGIYEAGGDISQKISMADLPPL